MKRGREGKREGEIGRVGKMKGRKRKGVLVLSHVQNLDLNGMKAKK